MVSKDCTREDPTSRGEIALENAEPRTLPLPGPLAEIRKNALLKVRQYNAPQRKASRE